MTSTMALPMAMTSRVGWDIRGFLLLVVQRRRLAAGSYDHK